MKINSTKIVISVLIMILFSSCFSSQNIIHSMNTQKVSLQYLLDSDMKKDKKDVKIFLNDIVMRDSLMPQKCLIETEKSFTLPLLIVNIWNATYNIKIGQNVIKGNYKAFLRDNFINHINRSGNFRITNQQDSANYFLTLYVDSTRSECKYYEGGNFIFLVFGYSYSGYEQALVGNSTFKIRYSLIKNNEQIRNNGAAKKSSTNFIIKKYKDNIELRHNTLSNMAESLSISIKNCLDFIVEDLNTYFQ